MILYANRVRTRANLSNYVVHEGYRRFDHFFGTVYCPSLDHIAGRPYGLFVDGNNDTEWDTERYRDHPNFGRVKPGMGILIDLREPRLVSS